MKGFNRPARVTYREGRPVYEHQAARACTCPKDEYLYGGFGSVTSPRFKPDSPLSKCSYCQARELPDLYQLHGYVRVPRHLTRIAERGCPNRLNPCPFYEVIDGNEVDGTDYYTDARLITILELSIDEKLLVRALNRAQRNEDWLKQFLTVATLADSPANVALFIEEVGG